MKFDVKRLTQWISRDVVAEPPTIGGPVNTALSDSARHSLRAPITLGLATIGIFVVGFGIWAAIAPIWGAVTAPGSIRVEANRKTVKSRDGGVVREIAVREGDIVKPGQLLIRFDDTVPKAQVDIFSNQYDTMEMQAARLRAEIARRDLVIPADLAARRADPKVSAIIDNETTVYQVRKAALEGQAAVLLQRVEQLQSARAGLQIQVDSLEQQIALSEEELKGYQTLYEKGFAPKTLILRLARQLAESKGRRGALMAEVTRNGQQTGEARLQLASLYEQRAAESAGALREAETRMTDLGPRLDASREALAQTQVRAPAGGYVLGLTQHTIGGVAGAGEVLMDIVPTNAPLVINAQVRPNDIDEIRPGMSADVMLQAYSSYRVPKIAAQVSVVSADAFTEQKTGTTYYVAELRIPPSELRKLPKGVRLYPGMQAVVMIKTGKRTILSFLIGPIGEVLDKSLREQ